MASSQPVRKAVPGIQHSSCEVCCKPARKNQLKIVCFLCNDLYYKVCPFLKNPNPSQFKKLQSESWHCPPCRRILTKGYCTVCTEDRNVLLLECSICRNKSHSECVGQVQLGVNGSKEYDWQCLACDPLQNSIRTNPLVKLQRDMKVDGVKFLHLNIRSLLQKFTKLEGFLRTNNVDIFGITETNLYGKDADCDFEIENYKLIRRDRPVYQTRSRDAKAPGNRPGGGLALYISKDYKITTVAEPEGYYRQDQIEYLVLKLKKADLSLSVILIYSPQPNNKYFTEKLEELIQVSKKYKPGNEVFIIGDINIDMLSSTKIAGGVKSMLTEKGFFPLVNEPTRVTKTSAKCIDLVCTNCDRALIKRKGVVNLNWSDHYLVYGVRKYSN